MIDSLIYNRTKFVKESEYIKRYVGRTITKGANVYTYTFHSDGRFYGTQVGNTTDYQSTGTIAYQVDCGDDDVYVAVQSKKTPQFFKLSEFLQNGGVSHSPLIHLYHAVSRFRKEISMALSYLLFNKLKWFNVADNADSMTANGRNYEAVPKQVTIKSGVRIHEVGDSMYDRDINGATTLSVVGRAKIQTPESSSPIDCYFSTDTDTYGTYFAIIPASYCIPKWGG